ncbi:Conserved_hypothetical protein [Hexamita inflata]|uniref:Transmembrane protein n=1 Tax=Hexamita inflata TaxID=28002 RepID=A0AA86UU30_9EUKA|nr:Conserved hypothetical protein [Hexamita inflata]
MILTLQIKFQDLQDQMTQLEDQLFETVQNTSIFNTLQQQLDDNSTQYYDPKLFLFPMTFQNQTRLQELNISKEFSRLSALSRLNMIINPQFGFSEKIVNDAKGFIEYFNTAEPNLQNFFQVQFDFLNQSINLYNDFFTKIQNNLTMDNLQKYTYQVENEQNIFQFIVNGTKSEKYDLHFTSPVPLQKISKDVVFLINGFTDSQSILYTLHESTSVYDRIWFFQVIGQTKYINIINQIYQRNYLSLQATLNLYYKISQYIEQAIDNIYVSNDVIKQLIKEVIDASNGSKYIIKSNNKVNSAKYEIVLFIFGQSNIIQNVLYTYQQEDTNIHAFIIDISDQSGNLFIAGENNKFNLVFRNQSDYQKNYLPIIVKTLNHLFVSQEDEIGSVNDSVVVARSLYQNNEYIGMLVIKPNIFNTFSDTIMNSLDGLSGTTLKIRMMEQQHSIINQFFQFMPSISYQETQGEALIQLLPFQLNPQPQINFNDVISTTLGTVIKFTNYSTNLYVQNIQGFYQMQITRKEFAINVALSSSTLTTLTRNRYSTEDCVPPQELIIVQQNLDVEQLRNFSKQTYQKTTNNCLVTDYNGSCIVKNSAELIPEVKQKIASAFKTNVPVLCPTQFTSTIFQLYLGSDELIQKIQNSPEFGDVSILLSDYNLLKEAILNVDQTKIDYIRLKYMNIIPIKQKQYLSQDTCVLVKNDNNYVSSTHYNSLQGLQVVSPNIIYALYISSWEIMHFARFIPQLEKLLTNKKIVGIYFGHTWFSDEDVDYASLYEQIKQVENKFVQNQERKIVNELCADIARIYNTHYFMFSTNPTYNQLIQNEHHKSNVDGTNGKFKLSIINKQIFLTKPIITKNKSLVGTPHVQGYLTIQLKTQIFNSFISQIKYNLGLLLSASYYIIDNTCNTVYTDEESQEFQIQQILINYGYITESLINLTGQNVQQICTKNNKFWDTAYQRSLNNEFTLIINKNITRFSRLLSDEDYNNSAIFERTIIINATSEYYLSGQIYIKEFSILNEFLVITQNLQIPDSPNYKTLTQKQIDLVNYKKNIPQNLTLLDIIYPNITTRSQRIQQSIYRISISEQKQQNFVHNKYFWASLISVTTLILSLILTVLLSKQKNDTYSQILDTNYNTQLSLTLPVFIDNNDNYLFDLSLTTEFSSNNYLKPLRLDTNYIFKEDIQKYQKDILNQIEQISSCGNILNLTYCTPKQENFRSFTIYCTQQQYSNFIVLQSNLESWIPKQLQLFKFDCKLRASMRSYCVPTQKMFTVNQRNVSKLATRIQTQIQSRAYSKAVSQCPSRQELVDTIDDIPIWFDDTDQYYKRDNPNAYFIELFDVQYPCQYIQNNMDILLNMSVQLMLQQ